MYFSNNRLHSLKVDRKSALDAIMREPCTGQQRFAEECILCKDVRLGDWFFDVRTMLGEDEDGPKCKN